MDVTLKYFDDYNCKVNINLFCLCVCFFGGEYVMFMGL